MYFFFQMYTVKHFLARFLGLIIFPLLLYLMFFYIHLQVLNRRYRQLTSTKIIKISILSTLAIIKFFFICSGNGDGFYSSGFQSKLIGNSLYNASMPRDVAFGAVVSLKNHRTGGGYLHSHWHLYPEGVGARQQQVSSFS